MSRPSQNPLPHYFGKDTCYPILQPGVRISCCSIYQLWPGGYRWLIAVSKALSSDIPLFTALPYGLAPTSVFIGIYPTPGLSKFSATADRGLSLGILYTCHELWASFSQASALVSGFLSGSLNETHRSRGTKQTELSPWLAANTIFPAAITSVPVRAS